MGGREVVVDGGGGGWWLEAPAHEELASMIDSIPQPELALMGFWRTKGLVKVPRARAPPEHDNNEFRKRFINIDAFDPPCYCSAEVTRPRALQPQQYFRARCL